MTIYLCERIGLRYIPAGASGCYYAFGPEWRTESDSLPDCNGNNSVEYRDPGDTSTPLGIINTVTCQNPSWHVDETRVYIAYSYRAGPNTLGPGVLSSSYAVIPPCSGSGYDKSGPVVDSFTSSISGQDISATVVARDCGSVQIDAMTVCYSELPGPVETCGDYASFQSSTNGNTTTFSWNYTIPAEWPCGTAYFVQGNSNYLRVKDNVHNDVKIPYPADFSIPC